MNQYKIKFDQYTDEHLISMRSMGNELGDEAHVAIEEILSGRGIEITARPVENLMPKEDFSTSAFSAVANNQRLMAFLRLLCGLLVFVVGTVAAKILVGTAMGLVVAAISIPIWLYLRSLNAEKVAAEKSKAEGFSELMLASASGDTNRASTLIKASASVNSQSTSGYTALMLAVKNNHLEIAKVLVSAGADTKLKTKLGTTVSELSHKFGNAEMAEFISKLSLTR